MCNEAIKLAEEIYLTIPKKIQESLNLRKNSFCLNYKFRETNRNGSEYSNDNDKLQNKIFLLLEEKLKKDNVKYEYKYEYSNDEGFYGSDSIGSPSYYCKTLLMINF